MLVNNKFKPRDLVSLKIDAQQDIGMVLTFEVGMQDYITYNIRWPSGAVGNYDEAELLLRGVAEDDFVHGQEF